jgi:outer membrane protein OmpA-like peptidoglycan-associated protein
VSNDDTPRDGEKSDRSTDQRPVDEGHSGKNTSRQDPEVHDVVIEHDNDPPPVEQPKMDSIHIEAGETFVAENIYFNTDKSSLKPESYPVLDQIVAAMKAQPKLKVEVDGYTDDSGNLKYNLQLSEDRAKTVAKYLIKHGISKKRVSYKGKGAYIKRGQKPKPGQSGSNRRVEFIFSN